MNKLLIKLTQVASVGGVGCGEWKEQLEQVACVPHPKGILLVS